MPEQPDTEERILHTAGTIPGFPGGIYGAGRYLLNWTLRTVTRIEDEVEQVVENVKKSKKTTAPTAAADTTIKEN